MKAWATYVNPFIPIVRPKVSNFVTSNVHIFYKQISQKRTMASLKIPPFARQDVHEVAGLVKALEASTKKPGGSKHPAACKKHTFQVPEIDKGSVDSWQFRDWDYKRRDLPSYARGLFTYCRRDGSPEIAVRGYDKFFNVGEVHETYWDNVRSSTQGPYELSVKENGCIIFIAGLEGDVLLVCSKHSTGTRDNADLSHAVAGERWVEKHLDQIGKTKTELARELRKRNVTLVAELCDDSFEEHVLAYEPKDAGLYIHGVNLNLPDFATYSSELVHQFADEWGFKKALFLIKDDVDSMKTFLEECAETGSYDGRDTEGFVIRCRRKAHGTEGNYQDWFFKYKFEEPYLMYRQWRECTKSVISGRPPRFKKHKQITEQYLQYARRQLAKDPSLSKAYQRNHGIIAMRDGFLQEKGLTGAHIIQQEQEDEMPGASVTGNVILVPIASIGCGKTTVAIALTKLFGWGHVQNDNITGKSNRPKQFTIQVCNTLASHAAMIADRNNHQKRERKQIIDDVLAIIPDARFVALHYVHDPKPQMLPDIRKVTQERIFARGDNHQTIQAGTKSKPEIIAIMEGFLNRFEPINRFSDPDEAFDNVIDLDVTSSSRANLETVVSNLHAMYPKLVKVLPTFDELDKAIDAALSDYRPNIKHDLSFNSKKTKSNNRGGTPAQQNGHVQAKPPKLEYFAVKLPATEILTSLDRIFSKAPPEKAKMYRHLQQSQRVQPSFHVTLMHRASISSHPDLWSHLTTLHANTLSRQSKDPSAHSSDPPIGDCRVRLERVVWDDRVMCIVARLLDEGWETSNPIAHITVGTANKDIKPKESNELLQRWNESGTATGIGEYEISGHVEVRGSVKAIMQQH